MSESKTRKFRKLVRTYKKSGFEDKALEAEIDAYKGITQRDITRALNHCTRADYGKFPTFRPKRQRMSKGPAYYKSKKNRVVQNIVQKDVPHDVLQDVQAQLDNQIEQLG